MTGSLSGYLVPQQSPEHWVEVIKCARLSPPDLEQLDIYQKYKAIAQHYLDLLTAD
jgi:hypothetical protein